MRRILGALFALTIVVGGGTAAGAAAGGEVEEPANTTMTLDPTSGPTGTVFTVSGSDCTPGDGGDMSVGVAAEGTVEGKKTATPNEAGDWSTTFTVADDVDPDTVIDVDANCIETFGQVEATAFQGVRAPTGNGFVRFEYATAQFTVTATPATTEAPTTTADDTTTTTEAPAEVDATAAEPTVAQPTFTG